jgi:type IX secretion system PorP/SprF family membrane protein
MKKNLMTLVIFLFGSVPVWAQQDAQFSQYIFNNIYINPAYAGYRETWNVNAFYRNQWSGFPGAPKTMSLAVDGIAHENRYGFALQVVNDKIGVQNNTSMYASFALRIPIEYEGSGKTLAFGISAGVIENRIKISEFDPTEPVETDPVLYSTISTKYTPDARTGVFYSTNSFFAGLSADNIIASTYNSKIDSGNVYAQHKIHMYATVGGLFHLSDVVQFKPSMLIKEDFAGPTSIDINAFVLLNEKLWIGGGYRTALFNKEKIQNDLNKAGAVIGMVELFLGQKVRIGYAYEYSINTTSMNRYPTSELSLSYFFINPNASMLSPRFF